MPDAYQAEVEEQVEKIDARVREIGEELKRLAREVTDIVGCEYADATDAIITGLDAQLEES